MKICSVDKFSRVLLFSVGVSLLTVFFNGGCTKSVVLAKDGRAKAEIVVSAEPSQSAQFAAYELKAHLDAITGGDFKIVTETNRNEKLLPIYLGYQEATKHFPKSDFLHQRYLVEITPSKIVLIGRDAPLKGDKVKIVYDDSLNAVVEMENCPSIWHHHGTMDATYGFLQDYCAVRWLDSTESGTQIKHNPNLTVKPSKKYVEPFIRSRYIWGWQNPELWDEKRSPEEYQQFLDIAYPKAAKRPNSRSFVLRAKELFAYRLRLGGELSLANHSFYGYYKRFLDKNAKEFEAYHPEWFSKHRKRTKKSRAEDGVFAEFDTTRRPAQLCYSNPELIKQVVKDVRAYFDKIAAEEKAGLVPQANWGVDSCALEPMDNGQFCECDVCIKMRRPDRKHLHARMSDYWFTFVNKVAKEIAKSHPGKKVATLAYGGDREGPPSFPIEPNVLVHFCWDGNRGPNRACFYSQKQCIIEWRKQYPNNPMGIALYNGFPDESGSWYKYLPYPGYFASLYEEEMKFLRDLNIREGILFFGLKDEFEGYIGRRWLWEPSLPLEELKKDFFSSYGKAEEPIRKFYECVEARYCNTNLWDIGKPYRGGHMTPIVAWRALGTDEHLAELGRYMEEAERAVEKNATAQERARVLNWRKGVYEYMLMGKRYRRKFSCESENVDVYRTVTYGSRDNPFGAKDVLFGKDVIVTEPGRASKINKHYTSEKGCRTISSSTTGVVYRCDVKIKELSRFRIELSPYDELRSRCFFDVVGWKDGKMVTLCKGALFNTRFQIAFGETDEPATACMDIIFKSGSVPKDLDAIGIVERAGEKKYYSPRYWRFMAEDKQ